MTTHLRDRSPSLAVTLVRNVPSTVWLTASLLSFMIIIGLIGSAWLPMVTTMVNSVS